MEYYKQLTYQFVIIFLIFSGIIFQAFPQNIIWEQTNGPLGGNMKSLALNNSGQLFAGGVGGIFQYTNENGWVQPFATQRSINAMASNHSGQLFAGTGRHGFYRSLDFGGTWERIDGDIANAYINSIDLNGDGDIFVSTLQNGIYRSSDLGDSWTVINSGFSTNNIKAVAFNTDGNAFAATDDGVFKSTNNGDAWIATNEGLTNLDIWDIAVSPNGDIFAISYYLVYRSTDNGENWVQLFEHTRGNNVMVINSNSNIFIGTGNTVLRSTDNGDTWAHQMQGLPNSRIEDIIIDASGRLYIAGYYGIYYSDTNGTSWISRNEGLKAISARAMLFSKNNYLIVIDGKGIYRSGDRGNNWLQTSNKGRSCLAQDPRNGNVFVNGYPGLHKSTDDGLTWTELSIGEYVNGGSISSIAINSLGHIFVLIYGYGVIRSTNDGITWSTFENNFDNINTRSIIIDSNDNLFVAAYRNGVFRSVDNGESWFEINNGFNYLDARTFAINDEGTLFVAMYNGEIYGSDNIGDSWEQLGSRMWNGVTDLTIHQNGDMFASSIYGVFRFDKSSVQWIGLNDGFGFGDGFSTIVRSLASDSSGYLYAGVWGNSVFRTINPIITSIPTMEFETPTSIFLEQNYPNPFNPSTKIVYQIPELSFVTLKVYDVLGNEVTILVNEEKPAGSYEINFIAINLSSGIYFYKLQAGSFVETKKMILLK